MPETFTKLFGSIVRSTVWQEDNETRICWFTLLALSDGDGNVISSIPGLCHTARISMEGTKAALKKFQEPDEFSRTPDFEGRRIEVIDGGWHLLNHAKYRNLMNYEQRKEYNRQKQAEGRAKKKANCQTMSNNVSTCQQKSAMSAHSDSDSDSDSDSKAVKAVSPQTGDLFGDTAAEQKKLSQKISEKVDKPEKTKIEKVPKQLNGYNPCAIWVDCCKHGAKCPEVFITGPEAKMLTQMGNCYSEKVFRGMLSAYGKICRETDGKIWKVFEFHRDRNGIRKLTLVDDDDASEESLNAKYGNQK